MAERKVIIPVNLDPASLTPPGLDHHLFKLTGETMGTNWSAQYYAPVSTNPAQIKSRLETELDTAINQFSNWDDASFISQFNRAEPTTVFHPDSDICQVIEQALVVADLSGGAFNPCLGAYTQHLAFSEPPQQANAFTAKNSPRQLADCYDKKNQTLRQPGGLQLDLSAIAKGYAVDKLAACLTHNNLTNFLVEIGGEFVGRGTKPDGTPWWVEVAIPALPAGSECYPYVAALCGLAMATSGTAQRSYNMQDMLFSHIMGQETNTKQITVFAATCAQADAWATALLASDTQDAIQLAKSNNIAALFILKNGRCEASPCLAEMLQ